jgi:hypothetical protein
MMVLDERARHELFRRLEEVLGPWPAETLMEMMPPVGWADVATKRDLDALEERVGLRFEVVDQRFLALGQRFETFEHKLVAGFRAELLAVVGTQTQLIGAQTKTLVMANIGAVASMAALAFGASKLG